MIYELLLLRHQLSTSVDSITNDLHIMQVSSDTAITLLNRTGNVSTGNEKTLWQKLNLMSNKDVR